MRNVTDKEYRAWHLRARVLVIKALGFTPEGKTRDTKYPATTGELLFYLSEVNPKIATMVKTATLNMCVSYWKTRT